MTKQTEKPADRMLKLSEIAKFYGICKTTVRSAILKNTLKAVKFGTIYRVKESDLKEFVKLYNQATPAETTATR